MDAPVASVDRLAVAEALRAVIDPEVGINIVDLGLIYDVRVEGGRVEIDLTMTTPACPLSGYIIRQIERALGPVPGLASAGVELVWSPPWSPAMMDEAVWPGRRRGGFFG